MKMQMLMALECAECGVIRRQEAVDGLLQFIGLFGLRPWYRLCRCGQAGKARVGGKWQYWSAAEILFPMASMPEPDPPTFHDRVDQAKRELLEAALVAAEGNRTRAAKALGLQRTHLHALIRRFGAQAPPGRRSWRVKGKATDEAKVKRFCRACCQIGHLWSECPNPGTFCLRHARRHRTGLVCPPKRVKRDGRR